MKTSVLILVALVLLTGCLKHEISPIVSTAGSGSWTYKGTTFNSTAAMWTSLILVSSASKPRASALEAEFSSTSPGTGNYTLVPLGEVTSSNQVSIIIVDSTLPAIEYTPTDGNTGTVSVSRSGSKVTITMTDLKLKGMTSDLKQDSILVSGTIVK